MSLTIYDLSDYKVKHTLANPPYRGNAPFDEYNGGGLDRYSIFQYSKVLPGLSALEMVSRDYGRSNLNKLLQSDNDWYRVYIIYRIKRYDDDYVYDEFNDYSYTASIQSMVEEETGFYLTLEYNDICYFNCQENKLSFKGIIDYIEETFSMNFNSDFAIYVEKIDE